MLILGGDCVKVSFFKKQTIFVKVIVEKYTFSIFELGIPTEKKLSTLF